MADTIKIEDIEERVVLVGVSEQDGDDADDSLSELAELVKTAGATVDGTLIQRREKIHPGTYVGTGKVAEIAELVESTGATGIVCDDELSPAQQKNLETYLDTKVKDRTLVILDIFASRATLPFSSIVPSTIVSIPSSISLVVNLIWFVVASMRIHSSIGMVVFDGTALSAILTLFNRLDLEQIIFIMCITPFLDKLWFL